MLFFKQLNQLNHWYSKKKKESTVFWSLDTFLPFRQWKTWIWRCWLPTSPWMMTSSCAVCPQMSLCLVDQSVPWRVLQCASHRTSTAIPTPLSAHRPAALLHQHHLSQSPSPILPPSSLRGKVLLFCCCCFFNCFILSGLAFPNCYYCVAGPHCWTKTFHLGPLQRTTHNAKESWVTQKRLRPVDKLVLDIKTLSIDLTLYLQVES